MKKSSKQVPGGNRVMAIDERSEADAGIGFVAGLGADENNPPGPQKAEIEISFVLLDYEIYALLIDHGARRLGCWQLVDDNKWVEPKDIADPLFNGKIIHDAKPSDFPPLPPWLPTP